MCVRLWKIKEILINVDHVIWPPKLVALWTSQKASEICCTTIPAFLLTSYVVYDVITLEWTYSPPLLYAITHLIKRPVFLNSEGLCCHCPSGKEACLRKFLQFLDFDVVWLFLAVLVTVSRGIEISTGRFIMLSVITDIYNKKTNGPTLMELFTATGKLKKFFFWQLDMFDVCTTSTC
jgi:hypothetical protein